MSNKQSINSRCVSGCALVTSIIRLPCVLQARQAELEAARLLKEKEEEEAKQAAQQAKKEKEIQKKAIKKERQKLRTTCKVRSGRNIDTEASDYKRFSQCCCLSLYGPSLNRIGITLLTMKLIV